jgi:1-acyl-sn-glycerol-3-phosphate acyltransferase
MLAIRLAYFSVAAVIGPLVVRSHLGSVLGPDRLPREGPFILVANHSGPFDHLLLATVVGFVTGRKLHFVAKSRFYNNPIACAWFLIVGAVPIDPGAADRRALRSIEKLLKAGKPVCIYPEGQCGPGEDLLPFRRGAFWLAAHTGVSVVPAAIVGSAKILPKGVLIPRRGRATVAFGPACCVPKGVPGRELDDIASEAREAVASLMVAARTDALLANSRAWLRRQSIVLAARASSSRVGAERLALFVRAWHLQLMAASW